MNFASGMDFYEYVLNHPTDLIDPSGLSPKPIKPYRLVPCNAPELAECRKICGSRGMSSCKASQTWRFLRTKNGLWVEGWKRGPMSCSCNENECDKEPQKQPQEQPQPNPVPPISQRVRDWLDEQWEEIKRAVRKGPQPMPGWPPMPGPIPVPPIPVPIP